MRLTRRGGFILGKNGDVWFSSVGYREYLSDLIENFRKVDVEGIVRVTMIDNNPLYLSDSNDLSNICPSLLKNIDVNCTDERIQRFRDLIYNERLGKEILLNEEGQVLLGNELITDNAQWIDNFYPTHNLSYGKMELLILKENNLSILEVTIYEMSVMNADGVGYDSSLSVKVGWEIPLDIHIPEGVRAIEEGVIHSSSGRIFLIKQNNGEYELEHLGGVREIGSEDPDGRVQQVRDDEGCDGRVQQVRDVINVMGKIWKITEDGTLISKHNCNTDIIDYQIKFTRFICAYPGDVRNFSLYVKIPSLHSSTNVPGSGPRGRDGAHGVHTVNTIILFLEGEDGLTYAVKDREIIQVELPTTPLNPLIINKPTKSAATRI